MSRSYTKQPMNRTKSPPFIFLFSNNPFHLDVQHNMKEKIIDHKDYRKKDHKEMVFTSISLRLCMKPLLMFFVHS